MDDGTYSVQAKGETHIFKTKEEANDYLTYVKDQFVHSEFLAQEFSHYIQTKIVRFK